MLFNINKQTFSLEIIFPLDPVIEQVKNLLKHGHLSTFHRTLRTSRAHINGS